MSRKPVGGTANETVVTSNSNGGDFDPSAINFMNVGSAAIRTPTGQPVEADGRITIEGDQLDRFIRLAQACKAAGKGVTLQLLHDKYGKLSDAQKKYYNAIGKVNVEYYENEGVISRNELYTK